MTDSVHQRIQDHYEDPYHRGPCDRPTHRAEASNTSSNEANHNACGDVVAVELRVEDELLHEIWFDGEGCQLSQSIASMLAEHLEATPISAVAATDIETLLRAIELPADPDQLTCCRVALDAIQSALKAPLLDDEMDGPTFSGPDLGDEC